MTGLEHLVAEAQEVRVTVNANDTFAYASADSFTVDREGLLMLAECRSRWGHHGVTALMAAIRDWEPIKPWRTDEYQEAREWLAGQTLPEEITDDES